MSHMARGYGNTTTQWQISGYHPEYDPRVTDNRLGRRIERSRRIGTLLGNWLWNTLIAGGIVVSATLAVAAAAVIISYVTEYLR